MNWTSGGPDRVPARLIDSNLDWGQDLVGLQRWAAETIPGRPIGLVYFGQINPTIFDLRGEPFSWFLPPVDPDSVQFMYRESQRQSVVGFAPTLRPGYYAVSASILYGLPWRLYDNAPRAWDPAWNVRKPDAFAYFRAFTPITRIGHSIYVYKLSQDDIDRLAPAWPESAGQDVGVPGRLDATQMQTARTSGRSWRAEGARWIWGDGGSVATIRRSGRRQASRPREVGRPSRCTRGWSEPRKEATSAQRARTAVENTTGRSTVHRDEGRLAPGRPPGATPGPRSG